MKYFSFVLKQRSLRTFANHFSIITAIMQINSRFALRHPLATNRVNEASHNRIVIKLYTHHTMAKNIERAANKMQDYMTQDSFREKIEQIESLSNVTSSDKLSELNFQK